MNRPYLISNIILQVSLIASFIIIIFFTYGIILEKDILDKQINFVINKFKPIKDLIPNTDASNNDNNNIVNSLLDSIKINDDPDVVKQIDDNNNKLKKKSFLIIIILLQKNI